MALKDAIKKVPLRVRLVGAYDVYFNLKEIANALGMNVDEGTGVLYFGDNPENGLAFQLNGTMLGINLYCEGVKKTSSGDNANTYCGKENSYLYYIKGKDESVAFGVSDNGTVALQFVCGKATDVITKIEKYGYFINVYGSYNTTGSYVMSDGYYKSNWFNSGGLQAVSDDMAHFYPMCSHQGDLFKNVYISVIFKATKECQLFTMQNRNYVALSTGNENSMRYIMEF